MFFLLCSMLVALSSVVSHAGEIIPEKRIYLVDLSGSMVGQGSVQTANVLDKMKSDLKATVDWVTLETDFVIVPFTEDVLPEIKGEDTDKQGLVREITSLGIASGNTDIASAWKCALEELDTSKVNYVFVLSDGYHNRGMSREEMYSFLESSMINLDEYDVEAYFVLLAPQYRSTAIAGIFDSTDRMHVVESMNICRQSLATKKSEQESVASAPAGPATENIDQSSIAQVLNGSDKPDKKCSWLWLWILLAIILIVLIAWIIVRLCPQISLMFPESPMSRHLHGAKIDTEKEACQREKSKVHFLPWVGKNYKKGIDGKRVLVLGESHYCGKPEDDTPYVTRNIIADLLDAASEHEPYKNTYTKFERALAGKVLDGQEKSELWNSIIFYNFVQSPISGPRTAPTEDEFKMSYQAFFEILERYRPDYVIAWGKRLYEHLPSSGRQSVNLHLPDGSLLETKEYVLSDGKIVKVLAIQHPSSGFSWDFWHRVIQSFFDL